jgi:hypothetical protein
MSGPPARPRRPTIRRERARVGELRPSQLLFSFGVGAIIDLPHISAMVMGLEDWPIAYADKISEERLLAAVRATIGNQVQDLRQPPLPPESSAPACGLDTEVLIGVPVGVFPQWMRCPYCDLLAPVTEGVFESRFDPYRPDRARFVHATCRKPGTPPVVVPARFLVACCHGHLGDFPWRTFLHDGVTGCSGTMRLRKIGASDEAADLILECESCGAKKSMAQAFSEQGREALPSCRSRRPHLRDLEEGCTERARPHPARRLELLVSDHAECADNPRVAEPDRPVGRRALADAPAHRQRGSSEGVSTRGKLEGLHRFHRRRFDGRHRRQDSSLSSSRSCWQPACAKSGR